MGLNDTFYESLFGADAASLDNQMYLALNDSDTGLLRQLGWPMRYTSEADSFYPISFVESDFMRFTFAEAFNA